MLLLEALRDSARLREETARADKAVARYLKALLHEDSHEDNEV